MDSGWCLFFRTSMKHLHAQREAAFDEEDRRTLDLERPNYHAWVLLLPFKGTRY